MPPIPIYTKSPINANKASGVTPQTAAGEAEKQPAPQAPPATTTAAARDQPTRTSAYPPAQPGAVPSIPAPTGSLTGQAGSPPAPQPGAVPPPPRAGGMYQPPAPPEPTAAPQYPPPQMSIPSPAAPLHYGGTATATGPPPGRGNTGVTQLPTGGAPGTGTGIYPHPNNATSSPYAGQYQPYGGGAPAPSDDDQGEGVWDSAKKYMQAAGSKLSAAESEVWKRINKQ